MKKLLYCSSVCVVLFILLGRQIYQEYSANQMYSGCIVVKKTIDESGKYVIINPNDVSEQVLLDFRNFQAKLGREFIQPTFDDGSIYFITRDLKDKKPYNMVKFKEGRLEFLPVKVPYSQKQDICLLSLKDIFVFAADANVFFISKKDYKMNIAYTLRKEYTNILTYREGTIIISKNNEVVYLHDDKKEIIFRMPQKYSFQGWFQIEENFLVYDNEAGESIIINLTGEKIKVLGSQPYSVLGNQDKNTVLLEMLPKGSGGATLLDFEYDWMDLIRSERRYCLYPFTYNIRTRDIKNLNMEVGFHYNCWQSMDFDKGYLEKISESLQSQ